MINRKRLGLIRDMGLAIGIASLTVAFFSAGLSRYRNESVHQLAELHKTGIQFKYWRDRKRISESQRLLPYQPEHIRSKLDEIIEKEEELVTSLDGAVRLIESDKEKLMETPEFREYKDCSSKAVSLGIGGAIVGVLMCAFSKLYERKFLK